MSEQNHDAESSREESFLAHGRRLHELEDLRAAEDVLLRFAEGQDRKDRNLFASAFHESAVMDFIQPASVFGVKLELFVGKTDLVETVFRNIAPLRTSHTVSNQRIRIAGDRATGTALVEAQHVLEADTSRHLLLKNLYDIELARTPSGWAITRMVIRNIWFAGDRAVLFPG